MGLVRYSRWASRLKTLNSQYKPFLSATSSFSSGTTAGNENPGRPGPPPIQVALTESSGRGVFATRKIENGELIHTAKPVLSHPSLSTVHRVCYFCLRKLRNTDTSQPQRVSFCSDDCKKQAKGFYDVEMRADWSVYDDYCRSHGLKYPLLVKRLACMVVSGAAPANLLDILQPASLFAEMISEVSTLALFYVDDARIMCTWHQHLGEYFSLTLEVLTKQWYIGILARIRINAFRIELVGGLYDDLLSSAAASIDAEAAVGNAVYILPSFYNHDCDPNAHIIWIENTDARLKALRDVDAGEELRICYIDASMDHDARQSILSQGFGFQCSCLRCLSVFLAVMGAVFLNSFSPPSARNWCLLRRKRSVVLCQGSSSGNVVKTGGFSSAAVMDAGSLVLTPNDQKSPKESYITVKDLVPFGGSSSTPSTSLVDMHDGIGILKFLRGKGFFITGATGFLAKGKNIYYFTNRKCKILRTAPDVGKIFLLIKAKKTKEAAMERLKTEITNAELFKCLRQTYGKSYQSFMLSKLVPVVGNVCESDLGIEDDVAGLISKEVDVIVNSAANTTFHERLDGFLPPEVLVLHYMYMNFSEFFSFWL
ncbi:unnamed protein product [Malus baccata var. baccata]